MEQQFYRWNAKEYTPKAKARVYAPLHLNDTIVSVFCYLYNQMLCLSQSENNKHEIINNILLHLTDCLSEILRFADASKYCNFRHETNKLQIII